MQALRIKAEEHNQMAFTEDEAKTLLMDLIKRPSEAPTETIGAVYKTIITFHNEVFPVMTTEPLKKKKRKRSPNSRVTGWPSGVNRNEYAAWKEAKQAKGINDGLNPHIYKAERDGTPHPNEGLSPKAPTKTVTPATLQAKPAAAAAAAAAAVTKSVAVAAKPVEAKVAAKPAETKVAVAPAAKAVDAKPASIPATAKPAEAKVAAAEPVAATK